MTYQQMKRVLQSLHEAQVYLAKLAKRVEAVTPGHALADWARDAAAKIDGTAVHFKPWAAGRSGEGHITGWEEDDKADRKRGVKPSG